MPYSFSTGVISPLAEPPNVLSQAQPIFGPVLRLPHTVPVAFEITRERDWFPESLCCTGEGKQGGCEHHQAGSSTGLDPLMPGVGWKTLQTPILTSPESSSSTPLEQREAEGKGLTTSCLWDLQRGECVLFPWEQGWELKASGFAKAQEEVRMSSQACWRAASLPLPISSYPKYFHLSFFLPPHSPASSWYAGHTGCRGAAVGVVGERMEGQTPGQPLIYALPPSFTGAQRRGKGGLGHSWEGEGGCCINQK